jgi:hypothetical protein
MPWNDLRKSLEDLSKEQVVELLKGLHDLSPQNKAWLRGKLLPVGQDVTYLEECRRKVVKAVYDPARKTPTMPHFRDAKGVIAEYRKSTRDLRGTLDLMLTYIERGHAFTNDFGDIDEPFYDALINMLERFAVELRSSPARREMLPCSALACWTCVELPKLAGGTGILFRKPWTSWKTPWGNSEQE